MKNAIVYKAHLPTASNLGADLAERPWRDLAFGERIRHAFIESDEGLRVHTFPGGYAICLRTDEKIIPPAVVKAEVEKRAKKIEEEEGVKIGRSRRAELKEQVYDEFLQRALTKERYTWAYYDEANQLLFVDAASKTVADSLMAELVQACASIKTETINIANIKMGLTTRLKETIEEGESLFGGFYLGTNLKLTRNPIDEPLERVAYTESDITSEEVLTQLIRGFSVESLEIGMQGVSVRLTHDFHFKRFEWPDIEPMEEMDEIEAWQHETSVKVVAARGIVLELCAMMEYEPPQLEEGAA